MAGRSEGLVWVGKIAENGVLSPSESAEKTNYRPIPNQLTVIQIFWFISELIWFEISLEMAAHVNCISET